MSLPDGVEYRQRMFNQTKPGLLRLAREKLSEGRKNTDFIILCIKVDSRWREVVDRFLPDHDWESVRAEGCIPVGEFSADWSLLDSIMECFPGPGGQATEKPEEGFIKVVVLSDEGNNIYDVELKLEEICN